MKKYNPLYYLLFILLVMGTFASMAQNSYGLNIIGAVAFIFGLLFLIEIISLWRKKNEIPAISFVEPVCLFIISVVLGFRVFYIYFSYVEWLFGVATLVMILYYLTKMITRFSYFQKISRYLGIMVLTFHLSIILFLASLALVLFSPAIAQVTGSIALLLLLCFVAAGLIRKQVLVEGNNLSSFKMVVNFKGHSIILAILILLFSLYFGLNRVGVLPAIYSDEYPKAYFELVDQASSGKEKPIHGRYQYQEFMEKYDQFLKDNSENKQ
jgi:hypothetical protein